MKPALRLGVFIGLMFMSACSLPRGSATQAEIQREAEGDNPGFALVEVTRETLPALQSWPGGRWDKARHWPTGRAASGQVPLHRGDVLSLTVWDNQANSLLIGQGQNSGQVAAITVDDDGSVFLPYVGQVPVAGLTPPQARERLQQRMESIASSVQIQLSVARGRASAVDVLGAVGTAGSFPIYDRDHRVLAALADAGGIPTGTRNPQLNLMRASQTFRISAEAVFDDARNNIPLRARDTLIVQEDMRSFTALGAAGNESLVYFPKDEVTVLEGVALMNGLNETSADPKGVLLLRDFDAATIGAAGGPAYARAVFTFDLSSADGLFAARAFEIFPDDTVLATESPIRSVQTVFGLVGSVLGVSNQVGALSN